MGLRQSVPMGDPKERCVHGNYGHAYGCFDDYARLYKGK